MNAERKRTAVAAAAPQQQTVFWVIAILLAIIATALVVRSEGIFGVRSAYGDTPMVGARGIFAFTGQLDRNSYGLFMIDVDSSNVWCYQYIPGRGRLRLVAARSFSYDRYLEDYNCEEPTLEQTKALLADQRKIKERIRRGGIGPDESEEALGTSVPGMPIDSADERERD